MPDDTLHKRGRSLEDEYFRKKDRELIEKLRQAAATEQARQDLGRKAGLDDPELVKELQDLGFTPDTVGLLPLVPIIQMAWAEGGITKAERELIVRLARSRSGWPTIRPTTCLPVPGASFARCSSPAPRRRAI
jgi:hypothetical protein